MNNARTTQWNIQKLAKLLEKTSGKVKEKNKKFKWIMIKIS